MEKEETGTQERLIATEIAPGRQSNCKELESGLREGTLHRARCLMCAVAEGEKGPEEELSRLRC